LAKDSAAIMSSVPAPKNMPASAWAFVALLPAMLNAMAPTKLPMLHHRQRERLVVVLEVMPSPANSERGAVLNNFRVVHHKVSIDTANEETSAIIIVTGCAANTNCKPTVAPAPVAVQSGQRGLGVEHATEQSKHATKKGDDSGFQQQRLAHLHWSPAQGHEQADLWCATFDHEEEQQRGEHQCGGDQEQAQANEQAAEVHAALRSGASLTLEVLHDEADIGEL